MYKLIGTLKSRAFRVAWMLNELEQPFELDPVAPRVAELIALNPSGKIPVLLDGHEAIIDSVAICQYLADKHKRFTFPAGTIARARQDSFTQFAADDVESPLWTCAKHTFVLPKELRTEAVKPACRHDFDRAIKVLSQRLGGNAYVMGDQFTVPDLLLTHCAGWAESLGWAIEEANVKDYVARVRARPAFLKTKAAREAA